MLRASEAELDFETLRQRLVGQGPFWEEQCQSNIRAFFHNELKRVASVEPRFLAHPRADEAVRRAGAAAALRKDGSCRVPGVLRDSFRFLAPSRWLYGLWPERACACESPRGFCLSHFRSKSHI